jgi:hypothetical protein
MAFRLQGVNLFLTYPQCNLPKEDLLAFLNSKFVLKSYVIAKELHEDGHPHLHAVIKLATRCNITNAGYLDTGGFHPNIQNVRSLVASERYCSKSGDFISDHEIIEEKPTWAAIRDQATTVEEYLALVEKHYPRDIALNYDRIHTYATSKYKKAASPYEPPFLSTSWSIPQEILDWKSNEFPVCVILYDLSITLTREP